MIALYELKGKNDRRYSLFSWRARMALRHKGLDFETLPVLLSDKTVIAFSGGKTVPVMKDKDTVVRDSWKIAEYLENRYPDSPPLFGGEIGRGVTQAFNTWADRALVPAMLQVIAADIHERVDALDEGYFRQTMEKVLRMTLEESRARRDAALLQLGKVLEPLQATFKRQAFLAGAAAGVCRLHPALGLPVGAGDEPAGAARAGGPAMPVARAHAGSLRRLRTKRSDGVKS